MTVPIPLTPHTDSLYSRIGDERLRRLLWAFYGHVMDDPELSPIFRAKIGPYPEAGWPVHIARLEGFWRSVTHGPSEYRGRPGPAHAGLGIRPEHFDRWLTLWEMTLTEVLDPPEAAAMLTLAQRMRVSLQRFAVAP